MMKKLTISYILVLLCVIITQSLSAVNDVIIILDPNKNEKLYNNRREMVWKTLLGLQEKVAPIIVSSSILEIITNIRSLIGENNLQQLHSLAQTTSNPETINTFIKELISKHRLLVPQDESCLKILSFIYFDNNTLNCYFHKSANLVLLIPKQYIQKKFPAAANLNPLDQAQACGFNSRVVTIINDLTPDSFMRRFQIQETMVTDGEKLINNLTALFTPQKQTKWAIYLAGHGAPAQPITKLETAHIAGLDFNNFAQLMRFFNNNINTAYVHYSTCFSGGYNQIFLNEVLSTLHVNFIVSSEGLAETATLARVPPLIQNNKGSGLMFDTQGELSFSRFFELLNLFIDQPKEFVKIKGEKKEPLAVILQSIVPHDERNQPFIRRYVMHTDWCSVPRNRVR